MKHRTYPRLSLIGLALSFGALGWVALGVDLGWPRVMGQTQPGSAPNHHPEEAAAYYRLKRAPVGEAELPVERYLQAHEQMLRMSQYSSVDGSWQPSLADRDEQAEPELALSAWTPLGPGNFGGRTRALLIHPTDPNTIYAAAVSGGVWKTTNGGGTWRPLNDLMATLAAGSLAMDPRNPNVIYAGTGEGYFNSDALRGAGIFKTTDGGANWTRLAGAATPDFYFVNDLAVSPNNSQRVYAATRTGVWQSLDGGASWKQALSLRPASFGLLLGCSDIAMRTDTSSDFIFAACTPSINDGSAASMLIYRNIDAAGPGSWNAVYSEGSAAGRTSLAIAPSDQNIVYAVSAFRADQSGDSRQNGLLAVYRSTNFGNPGTWTAQVRNTDPQKLNTLLFSNPALAFAAECGLGPDQIVNRGNFANVIAVDPEDANRVWVGGIELFRSDDGGRNWGLASSSAVKPAAPQYAHADQHVIVFHPQYNGTNNQTVFIAGNGGIYRADNARAAVAAGPSAACRPEGSAVRWVSLNHSYAVAQFYHGLPFPDGATYFGGAQDNGVLLGTEAGGINGWRELQNGDGGYVAVDPDNPATLYLANTGLSIQKSTNGGATFSRSNYGMEGDSALFIAPFVMDPSNPRRLWAGGASVWRTENGGADWQRALAGGNSGSGLASAIAIAPTDSNSVLVGFNGGGVSRTTSGLTAPSGAAWSGTFIRSGFVSWLAFDPNDKRMAYATFSSFNSNANDRHVYKSSDGGATWRGIDGSGATGIPDIPAHCLVVDPNNTSRLYVGTDLGVFVSNDGGANWAVENTGFANVVVESLALANINGVSTLFAFTHGRGAWRVAVGGAGSCRYEIAPLSRAYDAGGGGGGVTVTAPDVCSWKAASNDNWISITSGAGGSGRGSVGFSVGANTSTSSRAGTATIAGRAFVITQLGVKDTTAPEVRITSPTTDATFTTDRGKITVSGTATDEVGVTQLTWSSDRSAGGFVSGTANWSFTIDPAQSSGLLTGAHLITVTARDAAGNQGRATLTVISRPESVIYTVAGSGQSGGNPPLGDGGPALTATLSRPGNVAVDAAGNLYITDAGNSRIRRVTRAGLISTIAGTGVAGFSGDGGPATAAQICPSTLAFYFSGAGLALDKAGNLYLADLCNNRVRRISPDGVISTVAGSEATGTSNGGFAGDGGPATAARLNAPRGIAVDEAGNLFIADAGNHRIRKVTTAGVISTVAGSSNFAGFSGDGGAATAARFDRPEDVIVDGAGNIFIADTNNHRIRKVTTDGIIRTVAGGGDSGSSVDGVPATSARLNYPLAVAAEASGAFYLSEASGGVRRVDSAGIIRSVVQGSSSSGGRPTGDGGAARDATVSAPLDLALDAAGNLLVADSGNNRIRKVVLFPGDDTTPPALTITTPETASVTTITGRVPLTGTATDDYSVTQVLWRNDRGGAAAANGVSNWSITSEAIDVNIVTAPGPPLFAGLNRITVTAWDLAGNSSSAAVVINYRPEYTFFTIAGAGTAGFSDDGGPGVAAQLAAPGALARDLAGNLFFADANNHRVRRLATDGAITTVAGSGQLGSSDRAGPAIEADLNRPAGLAVDKAGAIYVADTGNHRVRKIDPQGMITTIAGDGTAGDGGDGGAATAAQLRRPQGLALDAAGNLYIADTDNHRVRRVTPSGLITTAAGSGFGFTGDGGASVSARLRSPQGLASDAAGNLYIADTGNQRIRKVTPAGVITTVAGAGATGFLGDGVPANVAQLFNPTAIAVDGAGNLYIADYGRYSLTNVFTDIGRLRKVSAANGVISTLAGVRRRLDDANGDGNPAIDAQLTQPQGVIVDAGGIIYLADAGRQQIYKLTPSIGPVGNVSAASFSGDALAAESLAAAFGSGLATSVQVANALPLPTSLGGTRVTVKDSFGTERLAQLFFVSPGQVNYAVPAGVAPGNAIITATSGDGAVSIGTTIIARVAPGLFSANANGQGVAAAVALRVKADGRQIFEPVASFDPAQNRFLPVPLDLGPDAGDATDQVFLLLFGSGLRYRSGLSAVTVEIGGASAQALYAGAQGDFIGVDQVNVRIPRSLAGRGDVEVVLAADGKPANRVMIRIK